jgi:rod shape-determining protein MreD
MKSAFYLALFLLLIPFQASLLEPLSLAGIKPDLALALVYIIGLLTSPVEAALVGMGSGLLLDIGSAGLVGLSGLTRGLIGLTASLLGRRMFDLANPMNGAFVAVFSLAEGICIALFLQVVYGDVPFVSLLAGRIFPQAIYTGALGVVLLRLMTGRKVLAALKRRGVQEEL